MLERELSDARFEELHLAVQAEFLASVAAHRDGSGYSIPAEFVLATGVRSS